MTNIYYLFVAGTNKHILLSSSQHYKVVLLPSFYKWENWDLRLNKVSKSAAQM